VQALGIWGVEALVDNDFKPVMGITIYEIAEFYVFSREAI